MKPGKENLCAAPEAKFGRDTTESEFGECLLRSPPQNVGWGRSGSGSRRFPSEKRMLLRDLLHELSLKNVDVPEKVRVERFPQGIA